MDQCDARAMSLLGQTLPRHLYEGVAAMPLKAATPNVSCRC
jgi:hypothetical protein